MNDEPKRLNEEEAGRPAPPPTSEPKDKESWWKRAWRRDDTSDIPSTPAKPKKSYSGFRSYGGYGGYDDPWGDDDYLFAAPTTPRSFSGSKFWNRWSSAWSAKSTDIKSKLSDCLQSMRRIASIVYNDSDRMSFTWSSSIIPNIKPTTGKDGEKAYSGAVRLDPSPITSDVINWPQERRTDAVVGNALGRSAALQFYSFPNRLGAKKAFATTAATGPAGITQTIAEVVDNVYATAEYIEARTGVIEEFPGFEGYFTEDRAFYHGVHGIKALNAFLGEAKHEGAIAAALLMWHTLGGKLEDLDISKVPPKVLEWVHAQPPPASRSLIAPTLNALATSFDWKEDSQCNAPSMGVGAGVGGEDESVTSDMLTEADTMADYEHRSEEPAVGFFPKDDFPDGPVPIISIGVPENESAYSEGLNSIRSLLNATRAALTFRNEARYMDEYALKRGRIDTLALPNLITTGTHNIFRRRETISQPNVHFGLLIDESGSMSGKKVLVARQAAILIYNALKDIKGVSVSIYGHSGNLSPNPGGAVIYRYIRRGVGSPYTLGSINSRSQNLDSYAIAHCVTELCKGSTSEERRILIVVSDGQPSGDDYGGSPAINHCRYVCETARKMGVDVLGIGVPGSNVSTLASIYGPDNYVDLTTNVDELPSQLSKLIKSYLRSST